MFTLTFEVLLLACQQEKFYRMYLAVVRGAWEYFEITRQVRFCDGHYRDEIRHMIKEDMVKFSITVVQVAVSQGIDRVVGKIQVSCTSRDFLNQMTQEIQKRKDEFSIMIKALHDEKEEVLL